MTYKFIKIFTISFVLASLNIAWFWQSEEDLAKQRLQSIDEAIKTSRVQLSESNTDVAIDILQNAYSQYGETLSLCEALAYASSQAEQYASAAIYFEKAFRLSENNVILLLNAGRSYEKCNAIDSALSAYERYLMINPKDANISKEIAMLHEKQKSYQKALNSYMEFVRNVGRDPNVKEACDIASLFLKSKNKTQAKAWFNAALSACSADNIEMKSEVLAGLIDIALVETDMQNLEAYFLELQKINPKFLALKYPSLKADIDNYNAKIQEAKDALIEAKKLEEEEKSLEAKRLETERLKAEKLEQEKLEKEKEEALAKEAQALAKQKAEDEALLKESAAVRALLAPELAEVKEAELEDTKDAKPEENTDSKTEAVADSNEAEITAPDESQSTEQEGLIDADTSGIGAKIYECKKLLEAEEFSSAENLAHDIVAENPNSSRAWAVLAETYLAQSMSIDAYLAAKQALAKDKDNIKYVLLKIQIGALVEGESSILQSLLQADRAFPECPEILLAIARIYNNAGNLKLAKNYYAFFLEVASKKNSLYKNAQDEFDALENGTKLDFSIEAIIKDLEL